MGRDRASFAHSMDGKQQAVDEACASSFVGSDVASLAESRLFARTAEGDRAAIAEVWRANRRWVAAVLVAHAPRQADVDDLLQEVAATLVSKCHHIRDASSLRGWLRMVAVNAARMAARSASIERRSLRVMAQMKPAILRKEPRETLSVANEEMREQLSRIPPLYAEPLILQSMRGLSQRQIAELLDVPETTIETRLARARRMLRQAVAEVEEGRGNEATQKMSATL
jgi:RNA polymerase sigma factor (sigma-70 family)